MKRAFAVLVGLAMIAVAPPEQIVSAQERAKPAYVGKITEAIDLSKDGDEFTATGTSEVFDTNGVLIQTGCNTLTGTRLE